MSAIDQTKKQEQFYIVRTDRAGVFFCNIAERNGSEAKLKNARMIHYWSGAASLMQLSQEGVKNPGSCRFTIAVDEMEVLGVIQIIPCSNAAVDSINEVSEWKIR